MSTVTTPVTHPVRLTERINRIEPSATMAVVAEADKLRQQGIDVVDFGAGEPHFSTPQHVKDAAIAAIQANFSKYTPVGGTAELKDAIVHRHAVDFDSDYRREEAAASVGGKHALFNVISVLVDHGDDVILPVPYWVSFKDMVRYAGGNCVLLQSDESQGFRVTADMVAKLVTPKTKLIILNSPSNPSGAVISPEDMTEVVRLAHQRGIWVISDECLRLSELHGQAFFCRVVARLSRPLSGGWIAFEDLCDDRMADWDSRWALRRSSRRFRKLPESQSTSESDIDRAESGGCCA